MLPIRKFVTPEIIFGKDALKLLPQYILNFSGQKIFIVTDPGVIGVGLLSKVTDMLADSGIGFVVYANVQKNPLEAQVMEGARQYLESGCDVIVALGGGSPMDCAKGIGIVSTNNRHVSQFEGIDNVDVPGPPLICLPTTAGSAADVSQFAIINNSEERVKMAIISKSMVPDVALIDPTTTMSMDRYLTACTGVDALSHAIEAYVSLARSPLTDLHALESIRLIHGYLPQVLSDLQNYMMREKLMLASLQAGLAFSNASLGAVHAMAHSLGGFFSHDHGECNAFLLEHVVTSNYPYAKERYNEIGRIFGAATDKGSEDESCAALVNGLRSFRERVGVSGSLAGQGVTLADIPILADKAMNDPCMLTNPRRLTLDETEAIYEAAL